MTPSPAARAFLAYSRPTFMTSWTESLGRLSFRTAFVPLDEDAARQVRQGPLWRGPVWARSDAALAPLMQKIDAARLRVGGRAFVRTHTRSAKDSLFFQQHRGCIDTAWSALVMLHESERFHADAAWLALERELPVIALREWVDIPHGMEFRCFVRDHRLLGVAQRPVPGAVTPALRAHAATVQHLLTAFVQECVRRSGLRSAVYDLCLLREPSASMSLADVRLVEVNPLHRATDAYAFDGPGGPRFDGSFRASRA